MAIRTRIDHVNVVFHVDNLRSLVLNVKSTSIMFGRSIDVRGKRAIVTSAAGEWDFHCSRTTRVEAVLYTPSIICSLVRAVHDRIASFRFHTKRFAFLQRVSIHCWKRINRSVTTYIAKGIVVANPSRLTRWHVWTRSARKEDPSHGKHFHRRQWFNRWRRRLRWAAQRAELFKKAGKECTPGTIECRARNVVCVFKPAHAGILQRK